MTITKIFAASARRKRFHILLVVATFIWVLWPASDNKRLLKSPHTNVAAAMLGCTELRPEIGPYQEVSIVAPGIYCLAVDFWQRRLSDGFGHTGAAPHHHLIELAGGNVSINLMDHRLHSDGHSTAIFAAVQSNRGSVLDKKTGYGLETRNIEIKNGVIDLRGLGTGVALINRWDMRMIDGPIPEHMPNYKKSNFILENLLIKTENIGIILEGEGNIIRNCIIESGGSAAIAMAGPNGKIINNTIILKNPIKPASMSGISFGNFETRHIAEFMREKMAHKAAIALHQASGTIISGNRILVRGSSSSRHSIYVTDNSMDVHIEGNTIMGKIDTVQLVKGSTSTLKNNIFYLEKPWWKF